MKRDNSIHQPPKWATRFFRWYCNDHLSEAALGDFIELYKRRCSSLGKTKADLLFIWNVIVFLQPFALKRKSNTQTNHLAMLQNYMKIAWRTMTRQKMYTGIKIGGFALGLSSCIIIFLFIRSELSYDKHYRDGNRIFRIYNEALGPDGGKWTAFPAPVAGILRTDFPEIEKVGRLIPFTWYNAGSNLFRREDEADNTYEERFAYADPELLDILEIPMIYGNPLNALDKANTIVISKKKADKYFPNEDPTGKIVFLNDETSKPFMIGGVMNDFPPNSHLQFDFLITLTGVEFWQGEQTNWCCWNYNAYIKIRPDADPLALEKKLLSIRDNYYVPYLEQQKDQYLTSVKENHFFRLQAVGDIYLKSEGIGDAGSHGDMKFVWIFGAIACFILLLACINFVNLSTAKSANRAKEVGLRKVVGSMRSYLIRQFLTESLIYSLISFIVAIALVILVIPYFNILAGKSLTMPWDQWWVYPILAGAVFVIGIAAGIYPSFYLSGFKPIDVLKGSVSKGSRSPALRSVMVVFQFTTSIVLIIGTFIIYRQMNFILNKKIGFDKEQVIMIQGANTLDDKRQTFKEELLALPGVENVTISNYMPVEGTKRDNNAFWHEGKSQEEKSIGAQKWFVDDDYINTLGMKLVEGRNFERDRKSDSAAIIINQTMAKRLGFKKAVGERIQNRRHYTVIGVVEDFHFESMKGEIQPLALVYGTGGSIISVKVRVGDMEGMIRALTDKWNAFMPHQPIRFTFMDESYERMYADVQQMGRVFTSFAILAIIVACLGLFALSSYMVEQRSKEISIRLVLGASVKSIFRLLTQNFVKLVTISFVIAAPLAWYMMRKWLEDYTYKTDITWDVFILAGVISVVIALITVSYQSLRAALANPANSLRSE
jgi:putative ABC transport system permease protein